MSAGDRAAWFREPEAPQTTAERPALRPLAEEFPYLADPRADALRRTGRHRKTSRYSAVLATLKTVARKRGQR